MPTGLQHIQYGKDYPLVDAPKPLDELIADLTVTYSNTEWDYNLPLQITWLDTSNNQIRISDCEGETIFDSRLDPNDNRKSPWGGAYTVHSWVGDHVIVKMVTKDDVKAQPGVVEAPIDIRAVWCAPKHLLSINGLQGDVIIKSGTNTKLDIENNQLTIAAIAGAGAGKFSKECDDPKTNGIKSINGVTPDEDGRICIDADEGHHLSIDCHSLVLANSNDPCCPCDKYQAFSDYIDKVADAYRTLGGKAMLIRDMQECMAAHWNEKKLKPRTEAVRVALAPGAYPYFGVRIEITNVTKMPAYHYDFLGTFNKNVVLLSSAKTCFEEAKGNLHVLVNNKVKTVKAEYDRLEVEYKRPFSQTPTNQFYEEIKGCIEPGQTVFYEATFAMVDEVIIDDDMDASQPVYVTLGLTVSPVHGFWNESMDVVAQRTAPGPTGWEFSASDAAPEFLTGDLIKAVKMNINVEQHDSTGGGGISLKKLLKELYKLKRQKMPCQLMNWGN